MCSDLAGWSETVAVFIHLWYISSMCAVTYHHADFSSTVSLQIDKNHNLKLTFHCYII